MILRDHIRSAFGHSWSREQLTRLTLTYIRLIANLETSGVCFATLLFVLHNSVIIHALPIHRHIAKHSITPDMQATDSQATSSLPPPVPLPPKDNETEVVSDTAGQKTNPLRQKQSGNQDATDSHKCKHGRTHKKMGGRDKEQIRRCETHIIDSLDV